MPHYQGQYNMQEKEVLHGRGKCGADKKLQAVRPSFGR